MPDTFTIVGWLALALNVWGIWDLSRQNVRGWLVRLLCNLTWGIYAFGVGAWPLLANHAVFLVVNTIGWVRWARVRAGSSPCAFCPSEPSPSYAEVLAERNELKRELLAIKEFNWREGERPEGWIAGERLKILAAVLSDMLDQHNAKNYIELEYAHPDKGPIILNLQRKLSKTPAQLFGEFRTEALELLAEAHLNLDHVMSGEVVDRIDAFIEKHEFQCEELSDDPAD